MKKRLLAMLIITVMLVSSIGTAFAAEDKAITVFVDGKQIEFDVNPISENGRTLVPMRYIFEALGAEVNWIGEESKAVASKGDIVVEITLNSNIMTRNGKEIALDVPAKAIDGRTLVPARAVAEALDADVVWIGEEYKVDITSVKEKAKETDILDDNDAKARQTLEAYYDALTELDFHKMAEYCTNGEELKAVFPEGNFVEAVIDETVAMVAQSEGLTDEELKEFEIAFDAMRPLIDSIIDTTFENMDIKIAGVESKDGAYVYTMEISAPDSASVSEYFSGEEFSAKADEIAEKISVKLAIEASQRTMTDEEYAALYGKLFSEEFTALFNDVLAKTERITQTENITVVLKDGKWLVDMPEGEDISIDYKDMIQSFLQQ